MALGTALLGLCDRLAFTGAIPAGVAAALLLAATDALGSDPDWTAAGLAAAGTLVVYDVDRLRGAARDRVGAPRRFAFVERNRSALWALTLASGVVALALAWMLPHEVQVLCGAVLAVGLLHRRLKTRPAWRIGYVAIAWVVVTAGIPGLLAPDASALPWVCLAYGAAVASNLLATGLRGSRPGPRLLASARIVAALAAAATLIGPEPVRPLAAVPAAELVALAGFRPSERYGLVVLDGALAVGAALALLL